MISCSDREESIAISSDFHDFDGFAHSGKILSLSALLLACAELISPECLREIDKVTGCLSFAA